MESPVVIKSEVGEVEETFSSWVNTKGLCFLCLKSARAETKVISIRLLLCHLGIKPRELFSADETFGWATFEGGCDDIEVDLCKSCGQVCEMLKKKLKELEKTQNEVTALLGQTQQSISDADGNPKLLERLASQMENDTSMFNFQFVARLRKEFKKKCLTKQVGPQPNNVSPIGASETVNAVSQIWTNDSEEPASGFPNHPPASDGMNTSILTEINALYIPNSSGEETTLAEAVISADSEREESPEQSRGIISQTFVGGSCSGTTRCLRRSSRIKKPRFCEDFEYYDQVFPQQLKTQNRDQKNVLGRGQRKRKPKVCSEFVYEF